MKELVGIIFWGGVIYGVLAFIWYVIKRMLYSLVYVSRKAIEDAKEKNNRPKGDS